MSKPLKILVGVFALLLVASVVLTMFGKPPNLPLGPLQGMLAGEEEVAADAGVVDPNAGFDTGAVDCGTGAGVGATDPLADPAATGAAPGADPLADPNATGGAPGAVDPATGVAPATDPATGAPVASGADGWDGSERVVAAAAGGQDASFVSDTRIVAAEAVDPATGLPATGAVDPNAAPGAVDPNAAPGAVDPNAAPGAVDPNAAPGAADPATGALDPCAGAGTGAGAGADPAFADPIGGAGAGATGTPGATGAGATGTGGAAATRNRTTTDGVNNGNSPEALRAAKDATSVMGKAKIQVSTTASLVPSAGGIGAPAALRRYRGTVTAAVLVMKLDGAAQQQWTGAGKKVQADLVKSFLARLGKSYRKATRSVTVIDAEGNVLAIGDAVPRAAGSVKLF